MCAWLAHGHGLLGNEEQSKGYGENFYRLVDEFGYHVRG